jgi:hypothetical protein
MFFCQVSTGVSAISEGQKTAISENCILIRESLKKTQQLDAGKRVYLGVRFERILTNFIVPLNVKLVESNISNPALLENQSNYAEAKEVFRNNYIKYQQALEELVGLDCRIEPETFYKKLVVARERRKIVGQDIENIKKLALKNIELVTKLRGEL